MAFRRHASESALKRLELLHCTLVLRRSGQLDGWQTQIGRRPSSQQRQLDRRSDARHGITQRVRHRNRKCSDLETIALVSRVRHFRQSFGANFLHSAQHDHVRSRAHSLREGIARSGEQARSASVVFADCAPAGCTGRGFPLLPYMYRRMSCWEFWLHVTLLRFINAALVCCVNERGLDAAGGEVSSLCLSCVRVSERSSASRPCLRLTTPWTLSCAISSPA